MFARENLKCLCKYYIKLAKAGRNNYLHGLIEHELENLPPLHGDEHGDKIDTGKEDQLLDF